MFETRHTSLTIGQSRTRTKRAPVSEPQPDHYRNKGEGGEGDVK